MYDFYINLISGLVGALLVYLFQRFYGVITEKNSPYTGTWYDSIYDDAGHIVKQDIFDVKQRGDTLTGTIARSSPPEHRHRKWLFIGKMRGERFFAIFWSTTQDIQSYGCWYMTQVDDDHFAGYYLSLQKTINDENGKMLEELRPTRIALERKRVNS